MHEVLSLHVSTHSGQSPPLEASFHRTSDPLFRHAQSAQGRGRDDAQCMASHQWCVRVVSRKAYKYTRVGSFIRSMANHIMSCTVPYCICSRLRSMYNNADALVRLPIYHPHNACISRLRLNSCLAWHRVAPRRLSVQARKSIVIVYVFRPSRIVGESHIVIHIICRRVMRIPRLE